ncbi:MAG TPA: M12 family metallopeptidase [Thermoanaerobaculia bacterium]|jgi:hypothetical protein
MTILAHSSSRALAPALAALLAGLLLGTNPAESTVIVRNRRPTVPLTSSTGWPVESLPDHKIPIVFDTSVSADFRDIVRKAIKEFNAQMCGNQSPCKIIGFSEVSTAPSGPFVKVKMKAIYELFFGEAAYGKYPGYNGRDNNTLYLTESLDSLTGYRTIVHELGHAAGFYHEHQHCDIEKWVKISTTMKVPLLNSNFARQCGEEGEGISLGEPDFQSFMFYEQTKAIFGQEIKTWEPTPLGEARIKDLGLTIDRIGDDPKKTSNFFSPTEVKALQDLYGAPPDTPAPIPIPLHR